MRLLIVSACFILCLAACQAPYERQPLMPLPPDGAPIPYSQLSFRARHQGTLATEAFYVDRWPDIEYAAHGLIQTAQYLRKAPDVPPEQATGLPEISSQLEDAAKALLTAAQARDVDKVTTTLQRVNLTVHKLQPAP